MSLPAGGAFYYRRCADGVELLVRLTPKSAHDRIEGVETAADGRPHLKARVRAVPEKGKANQALLRLMADTLGLSVSAIEIASGDTARLKTVRIRGPFDAIEARLDALYGKG